jgi:hypothetical protein
MTAAPAAWTSACRFLGAVADALTAFPYALHAVVADRRLEHAIRTYVAVAARASDVGLTLGVSVADGGRGLGALVGIGGGHGWVSAPGDACTTRKIRTVVPTVNPLCGAVARVQDS